MIELPVMSLCGGHLDPAEEVPTPLCNHGGGLLPVGGVLVVVWVGHHLTQLENILQLPRSHIRRAERVHSRTTTRASGPGSVPYASR